MESGNQVRFYSKNFICTVFFFFFFFFFFVCYFFLTMDAKCNILKLLITILSRPRTHQSAGSKILYSTAFVHNPACTARQYECIIYLYPMTYGIAILRACGSRVAGCGHAGCGHASSG